MPVESIIILMLCGIQILIIMGILGFKLLQKLDKQKKLYEYSCDYCGSYEKDFIEIRKCFWCSIGRK